MPKKYLSDAVCVCIFSCAFIFVIFITLTFTNENCNIFDSKQIRLVSETFFASFFLPLLSFHAEFQQTLKTLLSNFVCVETEEQRMLLSLMLQFELFLFKSGRLTGCPALCMGAVQLAHLTSADSPVPECAAPLRLVDMANKLRGAELQIVAISN